MTSPDVVVAGAGAIGAAGAYELAVAGLRVTVAERDSSDGVPVVGRWPGVPGLFVATGHFRSGILLTPLTARLIRDWIVDGRSALPGEAFLPDRLVR